MINIKIVHAAMIAATISFGVMSSAHAIIINSSGVWSNPTGTASNINGEGTDQISWGTPVNQDQSSYTFTGNSGVNIANPSIDGSIFNVGTFTHNNFPIYDFNFTGVDLNIGLNILDDANNPLVNRNFSFTFAHEETPNTAPCNPTGTTICPDIVTIPTAISNEQIMLFGDTYELELLGFRQGGGIPVTQFITEENQVNQAYLSASLNLVNNVPEPTVLALLMPGFALSLLFAHRRKVRK